MATLRSAKTRDGFTLIEIVVALVLLALMAAVIVPAVVNQMGKGDVNRMVADLQAVGNGAKAFRVDVSRWPLKAGQLAKKVTTSDTDVLGTTYSAGLAAKWNGPYIDLGAVKGDSIATSLGGVIVAPFDTLTWGGTKFLVVKVAGVAQSDAKRISQAIDNDTIVTVVAADSAGKVRWKTGGVSGVDTLYYLSVPLQ